MAKFTAAVGRAPVFPQWASGYWQSKNRYRNQSELLNVVRGYRARNLPLAMIVMCALPSTRLTVISIERLLRSQ